MRRPPGRPRGFTLVEIMVTIVILGIIIVPITRLIIFSVYGKEKTKDYVIAFNLAKEKMERLRMLDADTIGNESNDIFSADELAADPNAETFRKEFLAKYGLPYEPYPKEIAEFEREVRVDPEVDKIHKESMLKQVAVTVRKKGGGVALCELVTLFSRY